MEIFLQWIEAFSRVPDAIPFIAVPALALISAIVFALAGLRRAYAPAAGGLYALGIAFVAAKGTVAAAIFYAGVYGVAFLLFACLLFLPHIRKKKGESREERIYRKFREELDAPPADALPPKVCCYEEPQSAEESGMRLSYATSLMAKLKACKLTPADRLELEALGRSIDACRGKPLTGEELSSLNDRLAGVLKLTAKYKL